MKCEFYWMFVCLYRRASRHHPHWRTAGRDSSSSPTVLLFLCHNLLSPLILTHAMNIFFIFVTILCSILSLGTASVLDVASVVQERHWSGMKDTVAVRFSPNSAHVFTMEKTGRIRVYNSIDAKENDFNIAYDISQQTFSW